MKQSSRPLCGVRCPTGHSPLLPLLCLLLVLGVLSTSAILAQDKTASPRPNIVLIMADDLSHYSVAAYGSKTFQTPNLDRLAQTGTRFNHCYSLPLCTPSRVAIMTGMHNGRNYVGGHSLELSQVTFGDLLKDAGYQTCFVGKWKLAIDGSTPGDFGFDEYAITEYGVNQPRYKNPIMNINGKVTRFTKGEYGEDVACDFGLDFIARNQDKPFLLYYPMVLIHTPLTPTPDSPGYEGNQESRTNMPDMVRYMDRTVGRVVAKLEELGLRENTLVLFTGDNGNTQATTVTLNDGSKYGGGKGRMSDEGVHVPLIANQPGVVPSGTTCDDLIDFTDFLPTLCELAGVSVPKTIPVDGISFLPQLRGKRHPAPRQTIYQWYQNTPNLKLQQSAFTRDYRLYPNGDFFHIPTDIKETSPLAADKLSPEQKTVRDKLQRQLDDHKLVPVAQLAARNSSVSLRVGEKQNLEVDVLPANATQRTLRWKSDNEAVAIVNEWGRLQAIKTGTANVFVSSFDKQQTSTIAVTVR